jgi:hypothetical protein
MADDVSVAGMMARRELVMRLLTSYRAYVVEEWSNSTGFEAASSGGINVTEVADEARSVRSNVTGGGPSLHKLQQPILRLSPVGENKEQEELGDLRATFALFDRDSERCLPRPTHTSADADTVDAVWGAVSCIRLGFD